jgi:hypothetical protein
MVLFPPQLLALFCLESFVSVGNNVSMFRLIDWIYTTKAVAGKIRSSISASSYELNFVFFDAELDRTLQEPKCAVMWYSIG